MLQVTDVYSNSSMLRIVVKKELQRLLPFPFVLR